LAKREQNIKRGRERERFSVVANANAKEVDDERHLKDRCKQRERARK
jgi:hypothetical protein